MLEPLKFLASLLSEGARESLLSEGARLSPRPLESRPVKSAAI